MCITAMMQSAQHCTLHTVNFLLLICRSCWNWKDRVCEGSRSPAWSLCAGLQLWWDIWLPGHGSYLCWSVPGWCLGMLWRVQPSGGENAVGCLPADPDHPGDTQGTGRATRWSMQCIFVVIKQSAIAYSVGVFNRHCLDLLKHSALDKMGEPSNKELLYSPRFQTRVVLIPFPNNCHTSVLMILFCCACMYYSWSQCKAYHCGAGW